MDPQPHSPDDQRVTYTERPCVVLLAGPNGAGKSTIAPALLQGELGVTEFINADVIASGLSAFEPERAAFPAGRIMLTRAKELASRRMDFAIETTLSSRSLVPWVRSLQSAGYVLRLVFLWLPGADVAVARVAQRVRSGGHHVPEPVVRRRYEGGLRNLFQLYLPLAASWRALDTSDYASVSMLAAGRRSNVDACSKPDLWSGLVKRYAR